MASAKEATVITIRGNRNPENQTGNLPPWAAKLSHAPWAEKQTIRSAKDIGSLRNTAIHPKNGGNMTISIGRFEGAVPLKAIPQCIPPRNEITIAEYVLIASESGPEKPDWLPARASSTANRIIGTRPMLPSIFTSRFGEFSASALVNSNPR